MVGEVDGGRGCGATRSEGNDVSPSGTDWIAKIAPQTAPTRRIGDELILQNSETGAATVELKDLSYHWINEFVNITGADSITVAIDSDEASPGAIMMAQTSPTNPNLTIFLNLGICCSPCVMGIST